MSQDRDYTGWLREAVRPECRPFNLPKRIVVKPEQRIFSLGALPSEAQAWLPLIPVKPGRSSPDGGDVSAANVSYKPQDSRLVMDPDVPAFGWLHQKGSDSEQSVSLTDANWELTSDCEISDAGPGVLVFNPHAILDLKQSGTDGLAQKVSFLVSVSVKDREVSSPDGNKNIEVSVDLAPYRHGLDKIEIILLPQGGSPKIPYPVISDEARYEFVAHVQLKVEQKFEFVAETRAFLNLKVEKDADAEVDGGIEQVPLKIILDDVLDRHGEAMPCEEEGLNIRLSPEQPTIDVPVHVLFGRSGRALEEPENGESIPLSLHAWLFDGQGGPEPVSVGDDIGELLSLEVVPQYGDPVLRLKLGSSETDRHSKQKAYELGDTAVTADPIQCEPRTLRVLRQASAAYQTLLELEFSFEGAMENPEGMDLYVSIAFESLEDACLPQDESGLFVLQSGGQRHGQNFVVHIGPGERTAQLQINADVQANAYRCKIDKVLPVGKLNCRIVGRHCAGGQEEFLLQEIVQTFSISPPMAKRYLAIDLGTSAISAATSALGEEPEVVPLNESLDYFESHHDERGSPFISSVVGLGLEHAWRGIKAASPSIWAQVPSDSPVVDPAYMAEKLGRTYSVAVPLAPISEFGQQEGVVVAAPKMLLMEPQGQVAIPVEQVDTLWSSDPDSESTRIIKTENLVADILDELAEYHLPWSGVGDKIFESRLVLTHPSRYSIVHKQRLLGAASSICERLSSDPTDVALVAESDAAAAYFLGKVKDADYPNGVKAIAFDLGAGTLDVSLVEAPMNNLDTGRGTLGRSIVRRRVGASVGGDTIDLIIYFIVDSLLREMVPDVSGMEYSNPLLKSRAELLEEDEPGYLLAAKRHLAMAIRKAKAELSDRCREAAVDGEAIPGRYGWRDGESLMVQVGFVGEQDWPVRFQGAWPDTSQCVVSNDYADLVLIDKKIYLVLSKAALMRPAMIDLMEFMTSTVLSKLFVDAEPGLGADDIDLLLVSGRAALWPMVYDSLAEAIDRHCPGVKFTSPQPPSAQEMKNAVALGALYMAHDPDATEPAPAYDRIGLLFHQPGGDGAGLVSDWREILEDEVWLALQDQVRVMLAPPGISKEELQDDPWSVSLLLATGQTYSAREISKTQERVRIQRRYDKVHQQFTLQLGRLECDIGGGKPLRTPALHFANYDVTERDAPPGYPRSIEPKY